MRISLLAIGKTDDKYLSDGINKYLDRLKFYSKFEIKVIPDLKNSKNLSQDEQKSKEAESILKIIQPSDYLVLLDEKGVEFTSKGFSDYLNKKLIGNTQHLIFLIGGPYGFHESVYTRANNKISLSKLTFSHQMIRLFFVEQLYRAFTILKGEPYHHE